MTALDPQKREAQKQWDADPCGANTVQGIPSGTTAFYEAARRHRHESYAPWMAAAVGFEEWRGRDVLEIGVGLGSDHYRFARLGNRMTALDLSHQHLRHTILHLQHEGLVTRALLGDAECMPFREEAFDLVYSFGVLHHTPHIRKALDEILRVLRPGGVALIGLYHKHSWFHWLQTMGHVGLLHGGLFRKGRRRLLSEIEYRSDPSSAVPLVDVYSRGEVRRLFGSFVNVSIRTHHVEAHHFSVLGRLLRRVDRDRLERLFGFGGWYLMIRAEKPR